MKRLLFFCLFVFIHSQQVFSQGWEAKDFGVGLYKSDENYDKELVIIKRGSEWNQQELYESGAFSGRGITFGGWIAGPNTNEYLNSGGVPVWLYKYVVTYPDGSVQEFGKYGFYTPGFGSFSINAADKKSIGKWKIDFYLWNRDNNETRFVGKTEFVMNEKSTVGQLSTAWPVKDIGIGIYNDAKYDTELNIVKRGDQWSQSELYANGNFTGRGNVFGTWIAGPHTNTYLNQNGVPIYLYKYKITYPDGSSQEFGNYGFYTPGFATAALSLYDSRSIGKFKIDYYVWNRETNETIHIGTREFTMNK